MTTYIFHRLIMGKVGIDNFSFLNGDLRIFFLQKCLLSSPLRFTCLLSKLLHSIGCQGDIKGKFSKKKIFPETIRYIKLILCIHVHDISLYINCDFYSGRIRTLVAMATYLFHIFHGKS